MPNLKAKYDAWNRLVELRDTSDNLIARYEYNGLGHRITKKTYSPTETRHYFYNENWQCLEERVDGSVDRTYVWGERGIDDMVCRERNTERLYPLTDPNGNVVAIADVSGDVKERYRYDAFGKVAFLNPDFSEKSVSDFDWDYLYTSRQLDKESVLQYSRFRYYHPELGRFINRDPIEYDAGDVNLYRYVGNRPMDLIDPFGLEYIFTILGNGTLGGGGGLPPISTIFNLPDGPSFPNPPSFPTFVIPEYEPMYPWLWQVDNNQPTIFDTYGMGGGGNNWPWDILNYPPAPQPPLCTLPQVFGDGTGYQDWINYGVGQGVLGIIGTLEGIGGMPGYDTPPGGNPNQPTPLPTINQPWPFPPITIPIFNGSF